jgi:hypothetical protein
MKKNALIASLVFFSSLSGAQTVKYELSGDYAFQINRAQISSWSVTSTCRDKYGDLHYAQGGASIVYNIAIHGTLTFGAEEVTLTATRDSNFDQNASDKTVKITWSIDGQCVPSVEDGHAVFDPAKVTSLSGAYSIDATHGTGEFHLTSDPYGVYFLTAGISYDCIVGSNDYVVPSTMMLRTYSTQNPDAVAYTGSAQQIFSGDNVPCPAG